MAAAQPESAGTNKGPVTETRSARCLSEFLMFWEKIVNLLNINYCC